MRIKNGHIFTIRGCMWDDGWEFDAPFMIYTPFYRDGFGGNVGAIEYYIEDSMNDLVRSPQKASATLKKWHDHAKDECRHRGWSLRGFKKRKMSEHLEMIVKIIIDDGLLSWDVISQRKQYGPFIEV